MPRCSCPVPSSQGALARPRRKSSCTALPTQPAKPPTHYWPHTHLTPRGTWPLCRAFMGPNRRRKFTLFHKVRSFVWKPNTTFWNSKRIAWKLVISKAKAFYNVLNCICWIKWTNIMKQTVISNRTWNTLLVPHLHLIYLFLCVYTYKYFYNRKDQFFESLN